jgi:hypothetical protein
MAFEHSAAARSLLSASPQLGLWLARIFDMTVTILALGTNKLVGRGTGWLRRNGLIQYVLPLLLLNESFGAYRVYVAGSAAGWW